jgi:site-specific recombinase XerD
VSESWFNDICTSELSSILGRRINVHLFKSSAITALLEKGIDMKIVSKYIAHHENVATTDQFYNLTDDTSSKNSIFN